MRFFNQCNISYTSYIDRLTKLSIKTLQYRRTEYDLITFFKLLKNDIIINSQTFLKPYKFNYLLRGNNKKYTCKYHFNNVGWQNSFFYRSVKMWNELPNKIVSCKNLKLFRFKIKKID